MKRCSVNGTGAPTVIFVNNAPRAGVSCVAGSTGAAAKRPNSLDLNNLVIYLNFDITLVFLPIAVHHYKTVCRSSS